MKGKWVVQTTESMTHTPELLFYLYRVKCKGITAFTKSSGGEGVNWSTLPILIIVHQHFGQPMFSSKGNGATDQIVYYTPDKSICYSLYEVK
jgi:hypothetical protein